MNEVIGKNKQRPIVTSVGNAWVICNSKSRPGNTYYFNTFSGQAVWNLSPEEIEKAKKYTIGLPISEIEKCPEPSMDPPMDPNINQLQAGVSRIYNEPFISGQIPNQMIPNIFPMGLMNVNNRPGVPNIVHGHNPLIWSNPPNNPAIASAPVIYVAYPQMNFQQPQGYSQSFPTDVKEEPNNYNKSYINSGEMTSRNSRMHDMRQIRFSQRNVEQNSNWKRNSLDLRQKLIRKRSRSMSYEPAALDEHDEEDCSYQELDGKNKNMVPLVPHINTTETSSKYDLSVLELLKRPHSKANHWFIVVDTEIILKNFPLLHKITDPDQDCYLLVPHHVMWELQQLVSDGGDVQTRRILRFLSQQIDDELAFKGQDMSRYVNDDDDIYKMLVTCEDLAKQNNVILLTNDPKYQRYKNDHGNVHTLTLNELIQILNSEYVKQAPLRSKSPTLGIKIVVPNDKQRDIDETKQRSKTNLDVRSISPKQKEIQTRPVPSSKPADNLQNENPQTPNSDLDVQSINPKQKEIQTRPVPSSKPADNLQNENPQTQLLKQHFETDHTTKISESVGISKHPMSPNVSKDREQIKLSRSISTGNIDVSTPRYRWRKKRDSCLKPKAKSLSVKSDQATYTDTNPSTQEDASAASLISESNLKPISPKPISPQTPSLSIRSSISSHKETSRPNIIIEETSTSGVISNTTLESDNVILPKLKKKTISVCEGVNFEMFSVAGQSMEDVLRTRIEEWVLRFVQIMEETLKEVMHAAAPASKCELSVRWAADLPELARAAIKQYSDHFDVVDAANRLSFKLQKIGHSGGPNIEPKQYMDMYSFGVYLIRSLKNVTEDCLDLNAAERSLKKLLYDIQNAYLDTTDDLNESANNAKPPNPEKEAIHELLTSGKEIDEQNFSNANNDFLSSRKGGQTGQLNKESQQNLTNAETKFFSSLALTKRTNSDKPASIFSSQNTHGPPSTSKAAQTPPPVSPTLNPSPNSPSLPKANIIQESVDNNNDSSKSIDDINPNNEKDNIISPIKTCFVRNFNSIPLFEEKINKVQSTFSHEPPSDEEYEGENYDPDAYDDEYYDQNAELYCDNELEEGEIESKDDEIAENLLDVPNNEDNSPGQQADNGQYEWFLKEFTDEIRRTIRTVLMLCSKFLGELKSSREPSQDIQDELRTACASLGNIKNALSSILDCESTTPEDSIMLLLKKANLDEYVPSKERLLEYRNIISKCGDQVNTCYDKVTLIIQVAGKQIA